MTTKHNAFDEMWGKNTIIFENEYGYEILGQDNKLYPIDACQAIAYMMKYQMTINPYEYEDNFGNEAA